MEKSSKDSSDSSISQLPGVELGRFGGSGDFRTALGAICQKSKPFPISASPFSLSTRCPSLSITTSAFFLLFHTPSSLFPTYFSFIHPKISLRSLYLHLLAPSCSFLCSSDSEKDKFLIYQYSGNKLIIKEQQQCSTCSDLSEMVGHMGKLNLLPDVSG